MFDKRTVFYLATLFFFALGVGSCIESANGLGVGSLIMAGGLGVVTFRNPKKTGVGVE